ncbi:MAG: MotA/TolQ/ExbB proton channel family protein [Candidatus Cloacimonetes bacterium]|nr:MotA/TolQ/ExbB proton channel family protein [Candidatus Cloacimonadota bacterium]
MRKHWVIIVMLLSMLMSFAVCFAQDDVIQVEQKGGGLEDVAAKIVGSGFVKLFKEGGFVMWPMLILVIWSLATIIWKIVVLSFAKINVNMLLEKMIPMVEEGNYSEAATVCENARGPVASILHMGLLKADFGVEAVEKAIENAAVLEMAFLEKGMIALATTINLAPMFGFFGTVVGMIRAFKDIAAAGEVEPTIVATGIQIALITTAAGLAVAIPVQFFNNIFVSMIDGLVMDMQKGSEKLIEAMVEKKQAA